MPSNSKEYSLAYYYKNKDKFREFNTKKIICEICNCQILNVNKNKHYRTKKHIQLKEKYGA